MKRLPVYLIIVLFSLGTGLGFIGCGSDDDGPSGPTLTTPQNLTATPLSNSSIELTWTNEDEYVFYRIQRAAEGGDWGQIVELEDMEADSYTDEELNEGTTYQYKVMAYYRDSESPFSNITEAATELIPPTDLSVDRVSGTEIALCWAENSEVEDSVEVQRHTSGNEFETLILLAADTETLNDTGLTRNTTYYYRIRAVKGEIVSDWSSVRSATTTVYTPNTPSNLETEVEQGSAIPAIRLSWTYNQTNPEDGFIAELSLTGEDDDWAIEDSIPQDRTNYLIDSLASLTTYYFRVYAYNAYGHSDYSNVAMGETEQTPPWSPTELTAEAPDYRHVVLNWVDNSEDELGFIMQRKTDDMSRWSDGITDSLEVDAIEYNDEDVSRRQTYNYRVCAFNEAGSSDWTEMVAVTVPEGPPNVPRNFEAEAVSSTEIELEWRDVSFNEDGFIAEISLNGEGDWTHVDSINTNNEEYTVTGLQPATTYYFRLSSYSEHGQSDYTDVVNAETWPPPPAAPSGLNAEAPDSREVVLSWDDNSDNEDGFIIQRMAHGEDQWVHADSIDANVVTIGDDDVYPTWTYDYRICSFNRGGRSDWSDIATVTLPDGPPHAPGALAATPQGIDRIHLAWVDRSMMETGFSIERRLEGEGNFSIIDGTLADETTYRDVGLEMETTYEYRVKAYREVDGDVWVSDYSDIANATTWGPIAFYDDYEGYDVGTRPNNRAYTIYTAGSSTVAVTSEDKHEGEQSVKFIDPNPGDNYVSIVLEHQPVTKGVLSVWVKMADNGFFGIIGADEGDTISFQIQFQADNTYGVRHGTGNLLLGGTRYPVEEWLHIEIPFDCEAHEYSILFNGQVVNDGLGLQLPATVNVKVVFICFTDATIEYVFVDDLEMRHVMDEGQGNLTMPIGPSNVGSVKIANTKKIELVR